MIRMKTRSCGFVKVTDSISRGRIAVENQPSLLQVSGKAGINTCNSIINMLYLLRKEGSSAVKEYGAQWRPGSLPAPLKVSWSPQRLEIGKAG